jgi:hypothetical protein
MPEPQGNRIEKAMKGLTIGTVEGLREAERDFKVDGLQEVEEQVWLDFGGRAEEFAAWATKDIEFSQHFVDATGNRDSPFDRPHFTYGVVLDSPTPVGVLVAVMYYRTNERNETIGATVAIGIASTDQSVNVKGRVNLTFQGYGQEPSGLADEAGLEG